MGFTETIKKLWPLIAMCVVCFMLLLVNEKTGFLEEKSENNPTETFSIVMTEEQYQESEIEINIDVNGDGDNFLTVENCEDLVYLLALKDPLDPSVAEFVNNYKGQVLEFDACIAYLNNHGDYKTRYDILIYAGDYSETSASGPSFQFEDVGVYDLGLSGLDLPSFVSIGNNVHIVAKVMEFNPNSGLFELDPISIEDR